MPLGPAARVSDLVSHPLPPLLGPGPGAPTVMIGYLPAWRGIPLAAVAALQSAKATSDAVVHAAETVTLVASVTPAGPAAFAAEQVVKAAALAAMGSAITGAAAAGADTHLCTTPSPLPVHGPGVVINGSATVMVMNMPACRQGDQLLEALGPPNIIVGGCPTVIIGG